MRKILIFTAVLAASLAYGSERSSLELNVGGGAWLPGLLDDESDLGVGPAAVLGVQTPMDQGDCIVLRTGYAMASSSVEGWSGINSIPLTFGYRMFPFFKRYAGARGLEPLIGFYGGGVLAWDSADDDSFETTTTGGGIIGAEIGVRLAVGDRTSVDLLVAPEWVPMGGDLAGGGEDLSGLRITAAIVF